MYSALIGPVYLMHNFSVESPESWLEKVRQIIPRIEDLITDNRNFFASDRVEPDERLQKILAKKLKLEELLNVEIDQEKRLFKQPLE